MLMTSGRRDLEEAGPAIALLVKRGYARNRLAALERVHIETACFVGARWGAIERVAAALLRHGRLSGRQVRTLAGIS
jgi:predicted component of type VI protein secretion system